MHYELSTLHIARVALRYAMHMHEPRGMHCALRIFLRGHHVYMSVYLHESWVTSHIDTWVLSHVDTEVMSHIDICVVSHIDTWVMSHMDTCVLLHTLGACFSSTVCATNLLYELIQAVYAEKRLGMVNGIEIGIKNKNAPCLFSNESYEKRHLTIMPDSDFHCVSSLISSLSHARIHTNTHTHTHKNKHTHKGGDTSIK